MGVVQPGESDGWPAADSATYPFDGEGGRVIATD